MAEKTETYSYYFMITPNMKYPTRNEHIIPRFPTQSVPDWDARTEWPAEVVAPQPGIKTLNETIIRLLDHLVVLNIMIYYKYYIGCIIIPLIYSIFFEYSQCNTWLKNMASTY